MYTDKETIERYMLTDIDSSFDDQIDEWIETAMEFIDNKCDRTFAVPTTATERFFDGNGTTRLIVDDFIDVPSLEITIDEADDPVDEDTILCYPANKEPKTEIRLESTAFSRGNQNISITAKWGYGSTIPKLIKWACTVFVTGIINFSNQQEGEVKSESIGRYSVTYKDEKQLNDYDRAMEILEQYRRY